MQEYLKTAAPDADEIEEPSPVKQRYPQVFSHVCAIPDAARIANAYIAALGGKANIFRVDACAETRLRLLVRDETQVKESELKSGGIAAVVKLDGQTLHLLAGLNANQYAAEMRA